MPTQSYQLPDLFALGDIESKAVLKAANAAHQKLGELKGLVHTMPNPAILLGTLPLQEAKESSAIENIVTTQDDVYQSHFPTRHFSSHAAKEVHSYAQAMDYGFREVSAQQLITCNTICKIQQILENNNAGFRQQMGTALKNENSGEIIYMPPQQYEEIVWQMGLLERFINDSDSVDYDPLVKMALIHHQFESIHPFYDGNGRTGRIINILYLIQNRLIDSPVLYLSRYINQHRSDYYRLLQTTRDSGRWEGWLLFMLHGVAETAQQTLTLVAQIKSLLQSHKQQIKRELPKIYSHELLNNLYQYPYTKIEFIVADCGIHRNTATKYLDSLHQAGIVKKIKIGREYFYINRRLFDLLAQ